MKRIAILLFDEVEVLDFAGPFEVFSVAARINDPQHPAFEVVTVATKTPISARGGLQVIPHHLLADCPPLDILLVPGGWGTRPLMGDEALLEWLATRAQEVELLLSVCTGSLLLGKAGLLDGLRATTHHSALDLLRRTAPAVTVDETARFVDNGRIITSAGIAAGIDMALHVVASLLGEAHARATAEYMEYPWQATTA
ncbi:MAG: DJ-1/PfpI family protein [Anaerolineae bacterium]